MHQGLVRTTSLALVLLAGASLTPATTNASETTMGEISDSELSQIRALIQDGKLSDAIKDLDMIRPKRQGSSKYFFLRGRAMQELKRNTDALADYTVSIFLDQGNVDARINRALTRGALGDINGALKELDQAALIDPENPVIPMNRGVTLAGLNRPREAIREFDRAIQMNRRYADAYRNRGIARHFMKDKPGACRDWRQASFYGDEDSYGWVKFYCIAQPQTDTEPVRK